MKSLRVLYTKLSLIFGILILLVILFLLDSFCGYLGLTNNQSIFFPNSRSQQFKNFGPSIPNKDVSASDYNFTGEQSGGLESGVWRNIGPSPTNEGYAGRVGFVKFDRRDTRIIYLGGAAGGLWKSTDGSQHWTPKTDMLPVLSCGSLDIDYRSGILYYGTGDAVWTNLAYPGEGIFKSTDYGETWQKIISTGLPSATRFYKIVVDPVRDSILYAATPSGLFKSGNRAVTWSRIIPASGDPLECTDVAISPDGMKVYAVGPGNYCPFCGTPGIGYWKSTDGGASFQQKTSTGFPHITNLPNGRTGVSLCESNPQVLYMVTMFDQYLADTSFDPYYVYKSTNGGENFSLINGGLPVLWAGNNANYNMFISASPSNPDICFMGAQNFYKCKDGQNFICITGYCGISETRADFHCMDFCADNPDKIIIGCDGGVYLSSDLGEHFHTENSNLALTQPYRIVSCKTNTGVLLLGAQDMGVLKNSPSGGWFVTNLIGDGGTLVFSSTNPGSVVTALDNSGDLYYSATGGISWHKASGYSGKTDWLAPIAADPLLGNIFYTVRNNEANPNELDFYRSKDYGQNWSEHDITPLSSIWNSDIPSSNPTALAVGPANSQIMFITAGNRIPVFNKPNLVFRSLNSGISWDQNWIVKGGTGIFPEDLFTQIKVDPVDPAEVLLTVAGTSGKHVFCSVDQGNRWTDMTGNLPNCPANDIVTHYYLPDRKEYFVATDKGVYRSESDKIQWQKFGTNLPNSPAVSLDYNRLECKLRAATFGRSVWETDIPGTIYVRDNLLITGNVADQLLINENIVICRGGSMKILSDCVIALPENKKITVLEGGTIQVLNNAIVYFTSQSGLWGGIEIEGNSPVSLANCNIDNTKTPLVINPSVNSGGNYSNQISITNCDIVAYPLIINNRSNVLVRNSVFETGSGPVANVCGIYCTGSDSIIITGNTVRCNTTTSNSIGINVTGGRNIYIVNNTITNIPVGISVSSGIAVVKGNIIKGTIPSLSIVGIGVLNCPGGFVNNNKISGYQIGVRLLNSSPELHNNDVENENITGNKTSALYCEYKSVPRLSPVNDGTNFIWDGGENKLISKLAGDGIRFVDYSLPDMDYGNNTVLGYYNYLEGANVKGSQIVVRNNCWVEDPPILSKFKDAGAPVFFVPYYCGAGGPLGKRQAGILSGQSVYLIDRGMGFFDTAAASPSLVAVENDKALLAEGRKKIFLNDFTGAVQTFEYMLQLYKTGYAAYEALNEIIYCYDRMGADQYSYFALRSYYNRITRSGSGDSIFIMYAKDLSRRALIKSGDTKNALLEYEYAVTHSTDSSSMMSNEISVIDAYTLINDGVDSTDFTGNLAYLKPSSLDEAGKMIFDRAYKFNGGADKPEIPTVFYLSQNYPNPFNPVTTIYYSLPSKQRVTLKVYDILGRLITTLLNEDKDPGSYNISFNGVNFASGIYFYRFQAGAFTDIKKMALVK